LIVDWLTFDFPSLKENIPTNKTGRGVGIFQMEEALVPHEYGMEMMNHQDLISYGKHVFLFSFFRVSFLFVVFFFC
jgi:hypothetical protein